VQVVEGGDACVIRPDKSLDFNHVGSKCKSYRLLVSLLCPTSSFCMDVWAQISTFVLFLPCC
jgi:hypothetical protein